MDWKIQKAAASLLRALANSRVGRLLIDNSTEVTPNFWYWLLVGTGDGPGGAQLLLSTSTIHITSGLIAAAMIPLSISESAQAVLLPLSAILFAGVAGWIGYAHSFVASKAARFYAKRHSGGLAQIIYSFYLSQLLILAVSVFWFLASLHFGSSVLRIVAVYVPNAATVTLYILESVLFAAATYSLEVFWRTIHASAVFLLAEADIADRLDASDRESSEIGRPEGLEPTKSVREF